MTKYISWKKNNNLPIKNKSYFVHIILSLVILTGIISLLYIDRQVKKDYTPVTIEKAEQVLAHKFNPKETEIELIKTEKGYKIKTPSDIIREVAAKEKFSNPDYLIRLAYYESTLNSNAISKINKDGSTDYGIFQWNSKNPPIPITRECALDIRCATKMTIKAINLGMAHHWTADKLAR